METAKVFWSGRSQAVRLPKEFRVEGREVRISRRGHALLLEPIPPTWDWLDAIVGTLDKDFEAAVVARPAKAPERPGLDDVFR